MRGSHMAGLVGLAGLAGLAVGACLVFAAGAFGASTWLVNGANPSSGVASASTFERLLEMPKGGIFLESLQIVCTGASEGTIGPGAGDTQTKIVTSECLNEKSCAEPVSFAYVGLPRNSEVVLLENSFYDKVTAKSTTGYSFTCQGGLRAYECVETETFVLLRNGTMGEVIAEYNGGDPNQPPANCGGEQGLAFGTETIRVSGSTLAVSEA